MPRGPAGIVNAALNDYKTLREHMDEKQGKTHKQTHSYRPNQNRRSRF
jgi:hypothetical protein